MTTVQADTLNIFVSYSHLDEMWVQEGDGGIVPWLSRQLKREGVTFWTDHALRQLPGEDYKRKIKEEIDRAHFAILLISQEFVASDFIQEYELPWIRERYQAGTISIIPLYVSHASMDDIDSLRWITDLQILPSFTEPLIEVMDNKAAWARTRVQILDAIRNRIRLFRQTVATSLPALPPIPASSNTKVKAEKLENADTHLFRAEDYAADGSRAFKENNFEEAVTQLTLSLQINPDDSEVFFSRGNAYFHLYRYEEAIADFTRAIELKPNSPSYYFNRGLTCLKTRNYMQALADYTHVIVLTPSNAEAYLNRGNVYFNMQDYEQALADYSSAIALNQKFTFAYINRGRTYYEMQQYEQALADFAIALEVEPDHASASHWRGLTLQKLGRTS